jgi:hypothetical protein
VQLHAQALNLALPCNAEKQHQLALRLSRTLLRPKRLTIEAADKPSTTDVGEALSIPELAATFSGECPRGTHTSSLLPLPGRSMYKR